MRHFPSNRLNFRPLEGRESFPRPQIPRPLPVHMEKEGEKPQSSEIVHSDIIQSAPPSPNGTADGPLDPQSFLWEGGGRFSLRKILWFQKRKKFPRLSA